ncbi:MAG: hypothetical protein ACPGWR_24550 [Ardenticatenaceae bacterium]
MFDWQVSEEEQPLPNLPQEERPTRRVRRWRLFGGLLLLLVMAGLFVFRWRLGERTEAMEADLRAFIRYEEQQRAFGLTEQANELMVSNAPKGWQQAYRLSFAKSSKEPTSLEVEEVELNGTAANVRVRLDDVPQVRFYRLVGQEWRRAPLSEQFWGEERQLELADEDMTIVYPAREEVFVQNLAADLQGLLQQWPAKTSPSAPFTIKIKPSEFAPALLNVSVSDDTRQIVLNSPNLMMQPASRSATDGGMRRPPDGEAGIRFGLADALLEEVDLDYQIQKLLLPGGTPFLGAIRNTFILRWALPDEAIPRQIWHDKVADLWKSPFLGQSKIDKKEVSLERTWEPRLSEATVLLMADYLYDQIGPEGLGKIIKQLSTAQSWDRIFYPLTGHYTIELENKVRWANNERKTVAQRLPFSATWLDMDPESGVLKVEVAGHDKPLSIQTADATLIGAEGTSSGGDCAALYKEVTITEGDWLTVGHELKARQLVVSEPEPAIESENMTLAPPDTLAYLAEQRDGLQRRRGAGTFVALSEDGGTTDLMTLPSLMTTGWHTQPKIPWPARFLLTLTVPNCEQAWLLMYDPQQGIVDRWLTSFSGGPIFPHFRWRPREGDFILRGPYGHGTHSSQNESYLSAQPGEPLRLLGEAENLSHVLGWLGEKMVTIDEVEGAVKLMNLKSGEVTKSIPLASKSVRSFVLSEDGQHLFYAYELPPAENPTLHVLDLESGQDKFIFSASDGESLWPISGGTDRLLLALADERAERLADLLLINLNASPQPTTIMEIPLTEYVTSGLACADDRVLMTIYDGEQTEVRMWQPDGNISTLLKTDKQLDLLSCR